MGDEIADAGIAAAVAARRAELGGRGSGPRPGHKSPWYERGSRLPVADRQRILDRPGDVGVDTYDRALSELKAELVAARPILSEEAERVVRSVAGDESRREEVFSFFRGDDVAADVEADALTLASVLLESRLPTNVTVHRGFDLTQEERKAKALAPGSVYRLDEPLAAWVDQTATVESGEKLFAGVAQAGQPGLYVGDMGGVGDPEILFAPGSAVRIENEGRGGLVDGVVLPPPPAGEAGLSDRLQRVLAASGWAWIVVPDQFGVGEVREGDGGEGYGPGMADEIVDERILAAVADARAEFGGKGSGPKPGHRSPWYDRPSKAKDKKKGRKVGVAPVVEPVRGREIAPVVREHRPERSGKTTGTGTKDDPIVTDSVEEAARAIGEDKFVRLNQPETVSTLLDKLAKVGADAKAKGEKAPTYDLCKVSVPGTNLFCVESKGIPRVKMPQLSGTPLPGSPASKLPLDSKGEVNIGDAFREHLASRGIKTTEKSMGASMLRATQDELNGVQVAGIMNAVLEGGFKGDKPIFVTRDNYVIDGHHRWAAFVGAEFKGPDLDIPVIQVDMDIIDALGAAHAFADEMGIPRKDRSEITLAARRIAAAVAARRAQPVTGEFGGKGSGPRPGHKSPWYDRPSKADQVPQFPADFRYKPGSLTYDAVKRMNARQRKALINHIKTKTGSGGKDSQSSFQVDGKYTPERAAFHREVIAKFVDHVKPPKGKPIATFLGGGPAAGKSTVLHSGQVDVPSDNEGKPPADAVLMNADEVKSMIPEFRDLAWLGDPDAAAWAHEESSDVAKMVLAESLKRGLNINVDGTGDASLDKRRKEIKAARDSGHVVNAVYVTVPTAMALERNRGRYEGAKKRKELARLVPDAIVKETHAGVSRVFPDLASEFDSAQLFSTDVPRGEKPIPIASTTRGEPLTIVNQGLWDGFLSKASGQLSSGRVEFASATEGRGGDDLVVSMMVDILTGREFGYAPELRGLWDEVEESVAAMKVDFPDAVLDVPGEFQMPVPQSELSWSEDEWAARGPSADKTDESDDVDDRAMRVAAAMDVFGGKGSGPRPGHKSPWYERPSRAVPAVGDRGKPGVDRPLFPGGLGPIKNPRTQPAVLPPAKRYQPPEDVDETASVFASAAPAMDGETREVLGRFVAQPNRVNNALRSGAGSGSDVDVLAEAAVLDSYLAKGSIPEDVVVYRSMQLTPEVANSIVPGATIQNPGFTSTTLTPPGVLKGQPSLADLGNVRLEIFVPKGTKNAAYVSHELESIGSLDREVLFGTNLNVRVDSVEEVTPDVQFPAERVVYASVVPSHSGPPSGVSREPNFAVRRAAALSVVLGPPPFVRVR